MAGIGIKNNYQRFRKHLDGGGPIYAFWRGLKYFKFLLRLRRDKLEFLENAISSGKLKIICSGGGVHLLWDNIAVTSPPGLNVAINTLGLWTDSSKADWQILEKEENRLKLKVIFYELPLSQIWNIEIKDEYEISWRIEMEAEEWLHIDEFRIICLASARYKTWVKGYQQGDFPRMDNHWHDLSMDSLPVPLIGLRFPVDGDYLPSLALEIQEKSLPALIQNPPLEVNAHIAGFRRIVSPEAKEHFPGRYRIFSGKINLFKEEPLLDTKIEDLRQICFKAESDIKTRVKKTKRALKVLLVNLPWQKDGRWGVRAGSRWPHIKDKCESDYLPFPFFLAYATSLLQKHSIDAFIIDAIAEEISEDKFLEKILGLDFDYLVTETSIPSFAYDLYLLEKLSRAGMPIMLCGPNSEIYKSDFLREYSFIDFVLYGEYEFTLLELILALQGKKDLSGIRGLIYNNNGAVKKNHPREPFAINLLPWPYRDGLPMRKYLDAPGEMLTPSVQMLASRGCPFKCQFCLWPQVMYQGHHYRSRNMKDVVDEMEFLVRERGFKSVYFDDDTFNIGKERMLWFCKEIRTRNLEKIQWAIMARPDMMDEEILENMKKSGMWAVKYGVESASQSLVDAIGKNMDLKKAFKMIKFTKEMGIKVHLTFTFGLPGETKETIQKTINHVLRLDPFSVQFSITTPFPGTEYYKILVKKDSIMTRDFSCYDGHSQSVIRLENLTPQDLEFAKNNAHTIWQEHLRKKQGLLRQGKRFYAYTRDKGIGYALDKTKRYLKNIAPEKKGYKI